MLSGRLKQKMILPPHGLPRFTSKQRSEANSMRSSYLSSSSSPRRFVKLKEKVLIAIVALATFVCFCYDAEVTEGLMRAFNSRRLAMSLNLGNGTCLWNAALQYTDTGFPSDAELHKTIIAGYPSGDKRLTFIQLEGLTGLSARDEWDFKFLGMTNQPFIKANYPHHEGIWGWGDVGDQVILVVSELKRVMVEYHDILWDIGYAQTFEEAYERIENMYQEEEAGVVHENPPVADFLVWRDLRVFDEIHWYSWFIDYYMEGGLMRDMFTHNVTKEEQWKLAMMPHLFTKFEMRYGRFVNESETEAITPSYDPMCATLSKGCYPVLVVDPDKLVDPDYGPAEGRKLALAVNGTTGFDDWLIEEEAWECIWNEIIINKKGIKTFLDRVDLDYESYTYSFEMRNEMWHQTNRLIEKYEVQNDTVAVDLVNILKGHRDALGVDTPADPISYEYLMGYHLAFPPFFPNQKPFQSDDDFFVNVHEEYENPDVDNIDSIIERRRAWFEEEMEKKRQRKITVKYYDATGWSSLPAAGLSSLTPYKEGVTHSINYKKTQGEFAKSDRAENVAALFQGYVHIDAVITKICLTSDDGSKLFIDDMLWIDNDGTHAEVTKCAALSAGVYKLDLEYFEKGGGAACILEFGDDYYMRAIPPRSWASSEGMRRYRELMRVNDLLEEDLRTLKETDIMGPTTRAEYNRRKEAAQDDSVNNQERKMVKEKYDFSKFDQILKQRKLEQLNKLKNTFGAY